MPQRLHLLDRVPLVDRLNGMLQTSWDRGWSSYPPLDQQALLAKAGKGFDQKDLAGGRSEEDVADFSARLEKLAAALEDEARLNNLGRTIAHGQLVRVIRQRNALGKLWARQPQLTETALAPPIIVVGQMRAGTTRIHRLLASDPALAATRFCDSWHPVPETPDLRPVWSGVALASARAINPWLDTLHPFGAARVDEELGWLASALDHSTYEAQWQIPSFTRWSEARGPAPVYREFARILRTDAANAGNARRPRVMKVPQFSEDLSTLLEQFPDARLVVARREPDDVLRSAISLVANQMTIQSDHVDLDALEQEWRRKLNLRNQRTSRALERFAGPVAKVEFEALGEDWEREIVQIYETLGLGLSAPALMAMRALMQQSAHSAHRTHAGQLARFEAES